MKSDIIKIYREILRVGKAWPDKNESIYIIKEARELFRKNKNISDINEVKAKYFEAESRLELAKHYKIPYPRYYNVAPNTNMKTKFKRRKQKMHKPSYMDSYYKDKQI